MVESNNNSQDTSSLVISNEPSSSPTIESLQREKLLLEIDQQRHPWRQPQAWFNIGTVVVTLVITVVGAVVTIKYQAQQADLKLQKLEIESKTAAFAAEEAKSGQKKAQAERDLAIEEAKRSNAERDKTLADAKRAGERLLRARSILTELASLDPKEVPPQGPFSDKAFRLYEDLGDAVFDVSIQTLRPAPSDDHVPKRVVEFRSDPPGMEVYVLAGTYMPEDKEAVYISPHGGLALRNNAEGLIGKTPCTTVLPIGWSRVKFFTDWQHQHSRNVHIE